MGPKLDFPIPDSGYVGLIYVQGFFFNWCPPKIHKYGKKLKYQNWCPPEIHKYGEKCPPKSAIGIPLGDQPPQSVLKRRGLVH